MIDASDAVSLRDGLRGFATGFSFPWHRRNRRLDTRKEVDHVPLSLRGGFPRNCSGDLRCSTCPELRPRARTRGRIRFDGIVKP
jgi:hypothetical protein